ncbi:MAG: radical SAM protein [Candidatus Odinarchaeota archaeon]
MKVRASIGSAIKLKKLQGWLSVEPTTIYLMTYFKNKCLANCSFCTQARSSSTNNNSLSRVSWPEFELEKLFEDYSDVKFNFLKRICIQAMNYKSVFRDIVKIVRYVKNVSKLPVSLSIKPLNSKQIRLLHEEGVERICFPMDAASEKLFKTFKGVGVGGPYDFKTHLNALNKAVEIFGRFNVTTHLIIGLGETEKEAVEFIFNMRQLGVNVGLFALTPLKGTFLEDAKPPLKESYRRVQLARYLIFNENLSREELTFDRNGLIKDINLPLNQLNKIIQSGKPFLTSGCPGCNRPYYNERVSGPVYNYPSMDLVKKDIQKIKTELGELFNELESYSACSK